MKSQKLTEQEIKEAFPDEINTINDKIQEWLEQREILESEIIEHLGRISQYDEGTRVVCSVIGELFLGKRKKEIDSNLSRLFRLRDVYNGVENKKLITDESIERAKDYPMENLVNSEVKGFGKLKKIKCPLHEEKTPSFTIYENNTWYCFGCSEGGDSITFIMKRDGMKFIDAVKYIISFY